MTEALNLAVRRRIYEFVCANPGTHFRGLARNLQVAVGALDYHVRYIEAQGLIMRKKEANRICFFPAHASGESVALLPVLRSVRCRNILIALLEKGPLAHSALACNVNVSKPTLSFHLERLKRAKLIKARKIKGTQVISVVNPNQVARVLIAHQKSFIDVLVDRFVDIWSARVR